MAINFPHRVFNNVPDSKATEIRGILLLHSGDFLGVKVQNLAGIIVSLWLCDFYEGKQMTATQLQTCQKHSLPIKKMQKMSKSVLTNSIISS